MLYLDYESPTVGIDRCRAPRRCHRWNGRLRRGRPGSERRPRRDGRPRRQRRPVRGYRRPRRLRIGRAGAEERLDGVQLRRSEEGLPRADVVGRSSPPLRAPRDEAVAKSTGFEMLADGGSRLFVQLSKQVDVEPEKADAPARAGRKGKKGKVESEVVSRLKLVLRGPRSSTR